MNEDVILTPFDYFSKGILGRVLPRVGVIETEMEVLGNAQSVDVSFEPDPARAAEARKLGILGRMAAAGRGMFEPFSKTPPLVEVRACVRKQYTLDHMRTRKATHDGQRPGPFPRLWVITPGEPRTVLDQYWMRPMAGWPPGFWEGPPAAPLSVVVLRLLPRIRETLLLRLMGRGVTLQYAVDDLHALSKEAWERQVSMPLLVAFRVGIPHDSLEVEEMNTLQQIEAIYADWEQQLKAQTRREVLREQLGERFGPLPAAAVERIEHAGGEELDRWIRRVLRAQTLDDVLAS